MLLATGGTRSRLSGDETHPKHSEETMKMRLLLALVGLTIGFVVPAFAQEKEEVNPKILAGIQANDKAFDDAFNKHDPAAIAALYSENAVLVIKGGGSEGDSTPSPGDTIRGVFTGRAAVEKRYAALFALFRGFKDHLNTLDQVHTPFATVPWAVGGYDVTDDSGHYKGFRILTYISAPDGKAWLVSNEIDVD
jgi:hypothetical protein